LAILSLAAKYRLLEKPLDSILRRALLYLKKSKRPVFVYLVSDGEMTRINREFRRKNKPTTVLAFAFDPAWPYPAKLERPLGEIYLAPDHIRKTRGEPGPLLVHGLVHLLGYTHKKNRDKIVMERLERRIISKIPVS